MTDNPFQSGPPIDSGSATTASNTSVAWHAVRLLFACSLFLAVPLFVAPPLQDMFAEFGIELPAITQLFLMLADSLTTTMLLSVPLVVFGVLGVEFVLYFYSKEESHRLPGAIGWLCLILVFGLLSIAIFHIITAL